MAAQTAVIHRTLQPVDIAIIAVYFVVVFAIGRRNAGSDTVNIGRARTATAAAVHTRCRAAADRLRNRKAHNQAATRITVLFSATLIRMGNIYLPSFFALSIISDMRFSSSRVMRVEETSSSAATTCSGESWKNVSNKCFTADRLAFSRVTVGR